MGATWPLATFYSRPAATGTPTSSAAVLCGSDNGNLTPAADGKYITALKGWGGRNYQITTSSDSAQYYFNQGLGFYYGYHFTEALASFKEASRLDPESAMPYWGQAFSMGPYYNTYSYRMPKDVPETVAEMFRHAGGATPKEKLLIDAMSKRYSSDMTNADRKQLNQNYSMALAALTSKYADDHDIGALYIDAVMLEHRWDFWNYEGIPRPWTNALVERAESILKKEQHPAVMHYYIHLVEASRTPQRALSSADALKEANPGIGHMVHMATHMYQRNGLYAKGVRVNEEANAVNNAVDRLVPAMKLGQDRSTHIFAVQSFCAMTAGMYKEGMPVYERARKRQLDLSPDLTSDVYGQFVYMMPVLARIRLGKWEEIQSEPMPDPAWKYAVVLDAYARGIASVRKGDLNAADSQLLRIRAQLNDSSLAVRFMPFNSPLQSCRIATALLEGEIRYARHQTDLAFTAFRRAVAEEDQLIYREPHDWVVPARQTLGRYLTESGQLKEAEVVFRQDLIDNPGNGWSLVGLSQCRSKRGDKKEAAIYQQQARQAFSSADVKITSPVL